MGYNTFRCLGAGNSTTTRNNREAGEKTINPVSYNKTILYGEGLDPRIKRFGYYLNQLAIRKKWRDIAISWDYSHAELWQNKIFRKEVKKRGLEDILKKEAIQEVVRNLRVDTLDKLHNYLPREEWREVNGLKVLARARAAAARLIK